MQKRFESDPLFKATLLLLQERIPKVAALYAHPAELSAIRGISERSGGAGTRARQPRHADTGSAAAVERQIPRHGHERGRREHPLEGPRRHPLARRQHLRQLGHVLLHPRRGERGLLVDRASADGKRPAHYEAIFTEARAEFRRRDNDFESHTEIVVSPEDDIELRRLRITNHSRTRRTIDVTSYAEVALASPAADALHPAFSNLFVQTEIIPQRQAILCTRRPRSLDEHAPWMFHLMAVHGPDSLDVSYETDRMAFIGRGRTVAAPQAMTDAGKLSGNQGSVLDPIVAIRHRMTLDPQQTATIDIASGMAETRDAALSLVGKYQDRHLADRVFDLAWTHSWVTLRQINATESDAQLYARLASSVIYANASLRAEAGVLLRNRRGQSGLWSYAISGDLPIVLLQIGRSRKTSISCAGWCRRTRTGG